MKSLKENVNDLMTTMDKLPACAVELIDGPLKGWTVPLERKATNGETIGVRAISEELDGFVTWTLCSDLNATEFVYVIDDGLGRFTGNQR